jgi:short-subunit dehydrogenase
MRSAYSGAKGFLNGLTGSFRQELIQDGFPEVVFSTVSPGIVKTDFGTTASGPDSRSMPGGQDADEVARIILTEAIIKKKTEVYTSDFARNVCVQYAAKAGEISQS